MKDESCVGLGGYQPVNKEIHICLLSVIHFTCEVVHIIQLIYFFLTKKEIIVFSQLLLMIKSLEQGGLFQDIFITKNAITLVVFGPYRGVFIYTTSVVFCISLSGVSTMSSNFQSLCIGRSLGTCTSHQLDTLDSTNYKFEQVPKLSKQIGSGMCILATFEEILCYKQPFELSLCTSATACENSTLCLTGPVNLLIYSLSNAGKADRAAQ